MDIELATDGPRRFDAYLARPTSGQPGPGLLILSEMFGLNHVMRSLADEYAAKGCCTLVANVFWRSTPTGALDYEGPDRDIAWARLAALDFDQAARDLATALAHLRADPGCAGRVTALGFCAGGRLAYLAAARTDIDAAIAFYALGISNHLHEAAAVTCPVQLHYGLRDPHVPAAEIETVRAALSERRNVALFAYPQSGHSFMNAVRPTFDAAAAALAQRRVDQLIATP